MPQKDFTVDSLARYLHLTPPQVARMADRGKLPGRKVAGEWRFARPEIHHWLERQIGAADDDAELAQMESVLRRSAGVADQPHTVSISDALPVEAIAVPLGAKTRNSVINSMIELAAGTGWLWDSAAMVEAVEAREAMYPTAQENGVALLHPRRPMSAILGQAFLSLGITTTGVPFGGGSGLTDVFFLICSVDDPGHLRVVARLSRVINAAGFLDRLRAAPDAVSAREVIRETETGLP